MPAQEGPKRSLYEVIATEDPECGEQQPRPTQTRWRFRHSVVGAVLLLAAVGTVLLSSVGGDDDDDDESASSEVFSVANLLAGINEQQSDDPCANFPHLNLEAVTHNNLGRKGPDNGSEGIVFTGSETAHGRTRAVRVEIHALSEYAEHNPEELNGLNGKFAQIFLKPGASVDLSLSVYDPETREPMHVAADFTFFDLDTGSDEETTEFVTVSDFDSHILADNTEIHVTRNEDGSTTFAATQQGHFHDNPNDPLLLTAQQKARAVTLEFQDMTTMNFTIGSSGGSFARGYNLVGRPSLLCARSSDGSDGDVVVTPGRTNTTTTTTPPERVPQCCMDLIFTELFCKDEEEKQWYEFWLYKCE